MQSVNTETLQIDIEHSTIINNRSTRLVIMIIWNSEFKSLHVFLANCLQIADFTIYFGKMTFFELINPVKFAKCGQDMMNM